MVVVGHFPRFEVFEEVFLNGNFPQMNFQPSGNKGSSFGPVGVNLGVGKPLRVLIEVKGSC